MKRRSFIGMLTAAVLAPISTIKASLTPATLSFTSTITTDRADRDGDILDSNGVRIDGRLFVSQQVQFERGEFPRIAIIRGSGLKIGRFK